MIFAKDIETIYLKSFLIIAEKIAMSIIEAISDANSIIDEIKTLVFDEKNVVDEFAEIITKRKFNEKNSIFMINWFNIDVDCQKFENRAMMKIRVMFEKLLICVFSFLSFFWLTKARFILFLHCFFFHFFLFHSFLSLRSNSCSDRCRTVLLQQQHFVQKSDFFSFCRFISFLLFVFVTQCFIWKLFTHVLIEKKFISSQFHRFILSWKYFFSTSFFVVSVFLFCSLSSLWCLKFSVVRCFLSVFEFYDSDRKHSNLMFSHVVVFSKRKFVAVSVFRERCFALIFFYFLFIQKILFSMYLKNFSTRSSMWKYEICVRKNWWWIEKISDSK